MPGHAEPGSSRPVNTDALPVAVDAMGSDFGPETVVAGAKLAAERYGVKVLLVGNPDLMGDTGDLPVKPASQVVEMGAEPASSVRRLKDSSIVRAAEAVRDGEACALISAGNTGAAMAASLLRLGRIRGISRPAIAIPFPVENATPTTLLDCGANAECHPEWLVHFAEAGTVYSQIRYGVQRPRVGILTIGEEAGKGNSLVKEAAHLLETGTWAQACGAEYVGNVESRELMHGVADVVVCDGFTGNVVLKAMEGLMTQARSQLRAAMRSTPEGIDASRVIDPLIDPVFRRLDAEQTGTALLLGVRGVACISHGSSTVETLSHAIATAAEMAAEGIVEALRAMVEARTPDSENG